VVSFSCCFMSYSSIQLSDAGKVELEEGLNGNESSIVADDIIRLHLLPGIMCNDGTILSKDAPLEALTPSKPPRSKYGRKNSESIQYAEDEDPKFQYDSSNEYQQIELHVPSEAAASSTSNDDFTIEGDPTETCILTLAVSLSHSAMKVKTMRKINERISEIPFDSSTKYMASMHFVDVKSIHDLIKATSASVLMQQQYLNPMDLLGDLKPSAGKHYCNLLLG
jgi:magnesium-transporting ATPase (P-type)